MNLVSRITNITMRPKEEWPVIAEEQETVQSLFTNVIVILAAIAPLLDREGGGWRRPVGVVPAVVGVLVYAVGFFA